MRKWLVSLLPFGRKDDRGVEERMVALEARSERAVKSANEALREAYRQVDDRFRKRRML